MSIEVRAEHDDGFPDEVVRTATENACISKFESQFRAGIAALIRRRETRKRSSTGRGRPTIRKRLLPWDDGLQFSRPVR